jgi:hypothetical protein
MRRSVIYLAFVSLVVATGRADARTTSHPDAQVPLSDHAQLIKGCLDAAADVYRLPPAVLVVLLNVEGGSLGHVSPNTNATVDIGPMQINQIWIPQVAAHWHATTSATFLALRDNFCANVEAGAWILRRGLDEAHGDFWQGVGTYHSHDPEHKAIYLRSVLKQVLRLRAAAEKSAPSPPVVFAPRQVAGLQPGGGR